MKKLFNLDFIGMAASVLCLIHCLALPWLIALLGTFLGAYVESPHFHNVMLALAIAIGLPVFIASFMKYKSKLILFTGVTGLALTAFGTIQEDPCCPVPTEVKVGECASIACETVCSTEKKTAVTPLARAKSDCASTACETECATEKKASVAPLAGAKSDCDLTACETECAAEKTEAAKSISLGDKPLLQGFNAIPLGVTLLIFAHFMNFRKQRSCKRDCCQ